LRAVYEKGFNATLFDSIDKALTLSLGGPTVSTLYYAVQATRNLPKEQFQRRPLDVLEGLKAILGEEGFRFLEEQIVNRITETFQVPREGPVDLAQAVEFAKYSFLQC